MWQLKAFVLRHTSYVTIYIPKSARIALLVQVANILYTCASNTQEKQIFDIRIFVRNGKERKSISLAFRFI